MSTPIPDLEDGPLRVITTNTVDTSVLGEYTVAYVAVDSDGATAEGSRMVHVVAPPEPPPEPIGKQLITPSMLTFVGGFRVPRATGEYSGIYHNECGAYVERDGDKFTITLTSRERTTVTTYSGNISQASPRTDSYRNTVWPLLQHESIRRIKIDHAESLAAWKHNGRWIASGQDGYATNNFYTPFLRFANGDYVSTNVAGGKQVFGGGFVKIPDWFADQYLDGKTFGIGKGGYKSGQGSCPGPSLAVLSDPNDQEVQSVVLLRKKWNGTEQEREYRIPDYGTPLYGPPVDSNGNGYWSVATACQPAWIDTPTHSGLFYWQMRGIGDLDYSCQCPGFSNRRGMAVYVYNPADLAAVAKGHASPVTTRAEIMESWKSAWGFSEHPATWVIGSTWDGQYLYLVYKQASDGRYDRMPCVAIYRIASEIAEN